MVWNHRCIRLGKTVVNEERCPWCGEDRKDQAAFENFYLNVLFPEDDVNTYTKDTPPEEN